MQTNAETPSTPQAPKAGKRKRKSTRRLLIELLVKLALIAVFVWGMLTFVLGLTIHYGNNMFPAIRDGDLVISYRLQKPALNTAVLYARDGRLCVGRVVGLSGNEIDISDNGQLTVNGFAPAEEVFYPTYRSESADITYPYTVGTEQAFILNDFRTDTNDSRAFGAVSLSDIKGPVLLTIRRRGF